MNDKLKDKLLTKVEYGSKSEAKKSYEAVEPYITELDRVYLLKYCPHESVLETILINNTYVTKQELCGNNRKKYRSMLQRGITNERVHDLFLYL